MGHPFVFGVGQKSVPRTQNVLCSREHERQRMLSIRGSKYMNTPPFYMTEQHQRQLLEMLVDVFTTQ